MNFELYREYNISGGGWREETWKDTDDRIIRLVYPIKSAEVVVMPTTYDNLWELTDCLENQSSLDIGIFEDFQIVDDVESSSPELVFEDGWNDHLDRDNFLKEESEYDYHVQDFLEEQGFVFQNSFHVLEDVEHVE